MTLGDSLTVSFGVDANILQGNDNYAVVTQEKADGTVKTATIEQSVWTLQNGMYLIPYTGVAAKEMTDTFHVVIYNANGVAISNEYSRTIEDYVYSLLTSATEAKHKTLYVDLLIYGAAAQQAFSYGLDNLASKRLSDEQKGWASTEFSVTDQRVKGEGYAGATLTLENQILLDFIYEKAMWEKTSYAKITFTDHYGNAKEAIVQAAAFEDFGGGTYKLLHVSGLAIADCNQLVTVTLYGEGDVVLSTSSDSVASYIARMSGETGEIYPAIMKLANSAYNFFH